MSQVYQIMTQPLTLQMAMLQMTLSKKKTKWERENDGQSNLKQMAATLKTMTVISRGTDAQTHKSA